MSPAEPGDTSKHRIYRALRRSIIIGYRQPGERLSVEELAQSYDTSVTPVRDALHILGQEGLVIIKARWDYFVTCITLKELQDLLELRQILELASVERAATRIAETQLQQLERVHAGYTGDDDKSYDRYTAENRRFHCLIAEASGNRELVQASGHLHGRLALFMVLRYAGHTMESTHGRIVQALRADDVTAARRAMLDELSQTRDRCWTTSSTRRAPSGTWARHPTSPRTEPSRVTHHAFGI